MACVPIPDPLARLLDLLAREDAPTSHLDPAALALARRFGWVFEYQGRVTLTGAGAYHAGRARRVGLLE